MPPFSVHFVFLNQYYPPDAAPTGVMLEAVVVELVRLGHEVTVICAEGGYADVTPAGGVPKTDGEADCGKSRVIRIGATRFGRGSFLGKLADYVSYYGGAIWRLMTMQPRPDRIIALTTPPFLSLLARICSRLRGGDHAHWVMDLYPDVMVAHGMLREEGVAHWLLAFFARRGFGGARCAGVVTLGPDMAERVNAYLPSDRKAEWVPLWGAGKIDRKSEEGGEARISLMTRMGGEGVGSGQCSVFREEGSDTGSPVSAVICQGERAGRRDTEKHIAAGVLRLRRERGWRDDELVVMYSGNMGRGHRFGEIFGAAVVMAGRNGQGSPAPTGGGLSAKDSGELDPTAWLNKAHTRFVFFGGGKRKAEISEFAAKHPECAVELHDYSSAANLKEHLQSADIQLASLDGKWTGTMVPSKLQGIFEIGRPAVFIGSRDSSIGKWILESGGGWLVEPGDVQGLVAAIDDGRDLEVRRERAEAAATFAVKNFSREANVARLVRFFGG